MKLAIVLTFTHEVNGGLSYYELLLRCTAVALLLVQYYELLLRCTAVALLLVQSPRFSSFILRL